MPLSRSAAVFMHALRDGTMREFPERDWRVLRSLKDEALSRLCKRILKEVQPLVADAEDSSRGWHERYLALWALVRERNEDVAIAFDGLRRSTAMLQLAAMRRMNLLTDEEFMRFSQDTRDCINRLLRVA